MTNIAPTRTPISPAVLYVFHVRVFDQLLTIKPKLYRIAYKMERIENRVHLSHKTLEYNFVLSPFFLYDSLKYTGITVRASLNNRRGALPSAYVLRLTHNHYRHFGNPGRSSPARAIV